MLLKLSLLLTFLAVLLACRALGPAGTATPEATVEPPTEPETTPTAVEPTLTAPVAATNTPSATGTVETPTATAAPDTASDDDAFTVFEYDWSDRSLFAPALISEAQAVLNELPGATIYQIGVRLSDDYVNLAGREEVLYTNEETVALEEIYFRLFPNLAAGRATLANVQVNGEPVEVELTVENSVVRVPLPLPLQPGEQVVIGMDFEVEVPETEGGNYGEFLFTKDILALAHFYPLVAVYDDEGWNVERPSPQGDVIYADASFYIVEVEAPAELTLVGSGVAIAEEANGERQRVTFAIGPARDFYLAASSRYEVVSTTVGPTTVNSYAVSEFADTNEQVLDFAAQSIAILSEHFGIYPYTEFDVVATDTTALGIEYPGIVAVTQRVYDEPQELGTLEGTTAHEAGHQWFYNIVGNDQLDDPWLDEALAQYSLWLYFLEQYGPQAAEGVYNSFLGRWQSVDQEAIPIGLPVEAYEGPQYSAIVYGRGPLFILDLRELMGEETFAAFLRDYYATHQWQIATPQSFQALAEAHCKCDLSTLFEEWVYP